MVSGCFQNRMIIGQSQQENLIKETQIFVSPLLPNHILFLIVAFHSKTGRWSREGQIVQLLLVQLVYSSLRHVPNTKLSLPCSLFLSETFQLPQLSFIYNMFFTQNM